MGILKNHGGGKGFEHKPKNCKAPKIEVSKVDSPKKQRSQKDDGEVFTRGYPLVQAAKKTRKQYPVTSLLLEYLELSPPRSLAQLACMRGLDSIPEDWLTRSQLEQWGDECDRYDSAVSDNQIRTNWNAAKHTQQSALDLTDRLLTEVGTADPTDRELTMGLSSLAATVSKLVDVRFKLLEGLERPDSQSAVEVPRSQPISQLQLF